jgi:hypothetical protein
MNITFCFFSKRRESSIIHHTSSIIPLLPSGRPRGGHLPLNRGTEGGLLFFRLEEPGFFFLKVLISVRIGPADVRQMVEVYFRPAA